MAVLLYRVDDRLIHGQVVLGWGSPLNVRRIILVDDAVAAAPWEQDLFRMAVPPGVEVVFASVADAAAQLAGWEREASRTIVLTGDIHTMAALHGATGAMVRRVNLGGIHQRPGREQRLPYIYLDAGEAAELQSLAAAGVAVSAQDVPTAREVGLEALLRS